MIDFSKLIYVSKEELNEIAKLSCLTRYDLDCHDEVCKATFNICDNIKADVTIVDDDVEIKVERLWNIIKLTSKKSKN